MHNTTTTSTIESPTTVPVKRLPNQVTVFNDLVDSTPLLVELGDEAYTHLLDRLDAVRNTLLDAHGGRLANLAGDGALMLFPAVDAAVNFANDFNTACDSLGIVSRTGIHVGDVMLRPNGDLAGLTVHIAARIESTAPAGGVLMSAEAAAQSRATVSRWGWAELKGIPGATELMAVTKACPVTTKAHPQSLVGEPSVVQV